jgi:hypothetical protein
MAGKPTPPPTALPSKLVGSGAPQVPYGGHWWAGSVYRGKSQLSTWVTAAISVPSATPDSTEFYYVLLSIWDNTGSYDQIGFSDDYGVWGLTYSFTTGPCTSLTYVYSPDVVALTPGQQYFIAITTAVAPYVYEEVYTIAANGALTEVVFVDWNLMGNGLGVSNPGLEQETSYYCTPVISYAGYTDYEEVYGTTVYTQPDPYGAPGGLQFYFHFNTWSLALTGVPYTFTTWKPFWTSNTPPWPGFPLIPPAVILPVLSGTFPMSEGVVIDNFVPATGPFGYPG